MTLPIERSGARYKEIVGRHIRRDLGKYIRNSKLIGRKGKDLVSIPITHIALPKFRHYRNSSGGVGQGGDQIGPVGTPLGPPGGDQPGGAGDSPGDHIREVEITIEELAEIMGEELELPRIIPKGKRNITEERDKYTGLRRVGPEGLLRNKRMLRNALLRSAYFPLTEGFFDPAKHGICILPEDKRYLSWKTVLRPMASAVIIYMMDVSGSMTDEQKEIARIECFWLNTWLNSQYKGLRIHYIIHDAVATEVDEETFFTTTESGGTRISSAYRLCNKLMKELPGGVADWNVYGFHFSDGDNWGEDNRICINLLKEEILPEINLFGYVQVKSPYGTGEFLKVLNASFRDNESLIRVEVNDRDGILSSIKALLGKGK